MMQELAEAVEGEEAEVRQRYLVVKRGDLMMAAKVAVMIDSSCCCIVWGNSMQAVMLAHSAL